MTPAELEAWRLRHGHSLTTGAEELGTARRAFQDYLKGRAEIPQTVAKLAWALDQLANLQGGRIDWRALEEIAASPTAQSE